MAHTIKANYYKTSLANLTRSGSFGATGIIQAVKETGDRMAEKKSNEIIVIGKMDHTLDNTHESANRVYSKDGICPTIPTCAGGNLQPKIIDDMETKPELKRIGNIYGENVGTGHAGNVWDKNGLAPTLISTEGGNKQPMIIDDIYENRAARVYEDVSPTLRGERSGLKTIVAMRGRNPENPSDRTAGAPTEQRLEPNGQGLCNTLTSVQKDNLVLEKTIINDRGFNNKEAQVQTDGIMPTLRAETHGNLPKVIDMYNKRPLKDGVCGTITANGNTSSTHCGTFGIIEKKINRIGQISNEGSQCGTVVSDDGLFPTLSAGTHGYANPHICTESEKPECINLYDKQGKETAFQDRVYKTDKISPAITTSFRPNYAVEHKETDSEKIKIKQATKQGFIECKAGGVADFSYPDSKLRRGRVQGGGDVSPTLTSSNLGVCKVESRYRIRKLTPRECWRLMGFSDADFEKAQAVNSNTQLYKEAGNSIVKNVLMAIFGQMVEQGK